MIVRAFPVELRLGSETSNFTIHQCTFSASVQPVGVIFKIAVFTKIVITQYARNHSDFYTRMAVLGFELMMPCYIFFLIAFLEEVFITNTRIIFVRYTSINYTGLFISPSGNSELDCATTKAYTAERSISIGRESLKVFLVLGALAYL